MDNLRESVDFTSDAGLHLGTCKAKFKKTLVGVDFSETGVSVLKAAKSLAVRFEGNLLLAHAVPPVLYGPGATPELLQADLDAARTQMEVVISKADLGSIPHRSVIEFAEPTDLIDRIARAQSADLVIVGTHGAHGFEKLAFGSVAESVLRRVPCPVLVTGPRCREHLEAVRSIVFATGLEAPAFRPAQYASGIAEELNARLTLLHVRKPEPRDTEIPSREIDPLLIEELQKLLPPDAEPCCQTKVRVEVGHACEQVLRVAREEGANLIVVGVRESSSLADHSPWSTLSHIIRGAHCPVLAVRSHLV